MKTTAIKARRLPRPCRAPKGGAKLPLSPDQPLDHPVSASSRIPSAFRKPLPLLATFDQAIALYQTEKEPFYLGAFMIQSWLGGLSQRAAAEYAEKKNPRDRSLQSGEGWNYLSEMLGSITGKFRFLLSWLYRFSVSDRSPANVLRRALVPLSIEHHQTGDYFGRKTLKLAKVSRAGEELARRTLVRWCDWVDAAIHLRTHRGWHLAPVCFDADPENRMLAALGNAEKHLPRLGDSARNAWLWDFAQAAERYKDSPKWSLVGKAMSATSHRRWDYADVDTYVIALWPLVKAYNWTYRDLLTVIKPALKRPGVYPCSSEQDFATYCVNVLGLRKTGKGISAKDGRPEAYEIARELCPGLQKETKGTKQA